MRRSRVALVVLIPALIVIAPLIVSHAGASAKSRLDLSRRAAGRPNIVLILTDDLDFKAISFLPRLQTLLADEGTTFSDFLVSDSLCCPSRSTILRGQYDHNHHVVSNGAPDGGYRKFLGLGEEGSTIATWLRARGYATVLLGKYLNGYPGPQRKKYVPPGWSEWYAPVDGSPYSQFNYTLNENGRRMDENGSADHDYLDDVLAQKASRFIESSLAAAKPFFVYLAPYSPHRPYTPPPRYAGAFAGAFAPRPPSFDEEDVSDKTGWFRSLPRLSKPAIDDIDESWRKRLESMLAVEDMVAEVIDALAVAGRLDDTYIFFTSDNGYHLGEHRLLPGKKTAFEEDIRVPLIVRGPGVPAGVVLPHLVGNVDLAPTFAELAGAATPAFVDGKSFVPLLRPDPPAPQIFREAFLLERAVEHERNGTAGPPPKPAPGPGDAPEGTLEPKDPLELEMEEEPPDAHERNVPGFEGLRLLDALYVEYADGEKEMYDLTADPYELVNVAPSTDPSVLASLSARLAALRACAGASCR